MRSARRSAWSVEYNQAGGPFVVPLTIIGGHLGARVRVSAGSSASIPVAWIAG